MGDDQQRRSGFGTAGQQQLDDLLAGCRIEIAGRFIGENQAGARGGGAGDGDALLFAA